MPHGLATADILSGGTGRPSSVQCAPPRGFRAVGDLRRAWLSPRGPFKEVPKSSRRRLTAAQKAGLRYEKKVNDELENLLGEDFLRSPWFCFEDRHGLRYCQPDGIIYREDFVAIIEIKLSFTARAWWQLRKLYAPVVQRAFILPSVIVGIICKNYDPTLPFPEPVVLLPPPGTKTLMGLPSDMDRRTFVTRWSL